MISHQELIQLIIAYTLTGALVFTVLVTCLSLVGFIKLADQKQQNKLFNILVIELVAVGLGFFGGFLQFDPKETTNSIIQQSSELTMNALTTEKHLIDKSWNKIYSETEKSYRATKGIDSFVNLNKDDYQEIAAKAAFVRQQLLEERMSIKLGLSKDSQFNIDESIREWTH